MVNVASGAQQENGLHPVHVVRALISASAKARWHYKAGSCFPKLLGPGAGMNFFTSFTCYGRCW